MSSFTCARCLKIFRKDSTYQTHLNRKTPCKKTPVIEEEKKEEIPVKRRILRKKDMGQYFTISEELQQFVFDHVKHRSALLLEPSFGAGHLLQKFKAYDAQYPMHCYEIDSSIPPIVSFTSNQRVVYGDFTSQRLEETYQTIIGNPPYVKQKKGNLYLRFIDLCFRSLAENGEMIFIVPSDFLKATSAASLIEEMIQQGSFTDFLFPHNETLFEGANIDVVVFRYEKGLFQPTALVNGKEQFCNVSKGIVTFSESAAVGTPLESLFHVYVGLVSGRDEIYRVPFGNTSILCDKDKVESFIFTDTFPTTDPAINEHLLAHKEELLQRKIKKFTEKNWFEWGAPRNLTHIRTHGGKPCIYVRNLTRQKEVAFLGTVQPFGGSLLCLVPKEEKGEEARKKIAEYLNTPAFQHDYLYAGRFKMGHKQLSTAILPPFLLTKEE